MDSDSTKLNTVVTTISILATIISLLILYFTKKTVVGITVLIVIVALFIYYKYWVSQLKKWREEYVKKHNPTPHFEIEMNSRLDGSGIYVQPKIEMEDKDKKKVVKLLRDYFIDEVFVEGTKNGERVFCILGDIGMGKTAALVNFFVDYIQYYRKGNKPYDIWLYSLADKDVFNKINGIEKEVKGNSILLLDAVDENDEAKDDNTYDEFIKKLEQAYQDFAFVVTTCRPQFFGDETEVFDTTRARRNGFFLKCKQLHLALFDDNQVREYLYNLYYHDPNKQLKQKEAEKIVKKCPNIAQRPLVLSYIDDLVNDKDKDYETTLDIYDAIVTSLIRREVKKSSPDANENMMQQWRELLSEVAGYMYKNKKLSISLKEYEDILSEHNLKMPEDKKTFRQRSLLTRTTEGFQFSHKSFYEYFMAYRFFANPNEIDFVFDMNFALQLFDELSKATPEAYLHYEAETLFKFAILKIGQRKIPEAKKMAQKSLEKFQTMAKLSSTTIDLDVKKGKLLLEILEIILAKQAKKDQPSN